MNRVARALIGLGLAGLLGFPANAQPVQEQPYQHTVGRNTPCPNNQCIFTFPAVPMGKRLILTSVSAQLGTTMDAIVLEGSSVTYFVPKLNPAIGNVAQPITLYYEPGMTPTARIFSGGTSQPISLIVTVVGHLVPAM